MIRSILENNISCRKNTRYEQYLIWVVFSAKFGKKWLKQGFKWNTLIFFLFFCPVFSETRATILAVFTCFWGLKLKTPRWYSLKPGAEPWWNSLKHGGLRPPVSMNPSQIGSRFQWNHRGFQVLTPKTRETAKIVARVSLKPGQKKKMRGFLLKLFDLLELARVFWN